MTTPGFIPAKDLEDEQVYANLLLWESRLMNQRNLGSVEHSRLLELRAERDHRESINSPDIGLMLSVIERFRDGDA